MLSSTSVSSVVMRRNSIPVSCCPVRLLRHLGETRALCGAVAAGQQAELTGDELFPV